LGALPHSWNAKQTIVAICALLSVSQSLASDWFSWAALILKVPENIVRAGWSIVCMFVFVVFVEEEEEEEGGVIGICGSVLVVVGSGLEPGVFELVVDPEMLGSTGWGEEEQAAPI